MLRDVLLGALNHLLTGEEWAREHLKAFAGQTVRLDIPPLELALAITADGRFVAAEAETPCAVTIGLPPGAPLRLLSGLADRSSLMATAQIQGSADLADCLGFIFRNLRWDLESDLSPLVGDIMAHRLVGLGTQFVSWQQKLAGNLAQNLAEFLTEERPTLTGQRDAAHFSHGVAEASEILTKIEKRIDALESAHRQT